MATVDTGCRIHIGFQNLSLAHERLYGGIGIVLSTPSTVIRATQAETVDAPDEPAASYAEQACSVLGVPGASVSVKQRLPRHVGLGSGTQLALGIYGAIARAYDRPLDHRGVAATLGRGGRSGIGVASFETGGIVVDGGHPTQQFTARRPSDGGWTVPPVVANHDLPDHWRVVLAVPDAGRGRHGNPEDESMEAVVESASPDVADEISSVLTRQLLPAAATGDLDAFGAAVNAIERLNGAWYAREQGGVFRPPVGTIVDQLSDCSAVCGVGQSSWGPTVYGLTTAAETAAATTSARDALAEADCAGSVHVSAIESVAEPDR